jgi:hypothetical protein
MITINISKNGRVRHSVKLQGSYSQVDSKKQLLNRISTKKKQSTMQFWLAFHKRKRNVHNNLSATNPGPPGNDLQCG